MVPPLSTAGSPPPVLHPIPPTSVSDLVPHITHVCPVTCFILSYFSIDICKVIKQSMGQTNKFWHTSPSRKVPAHSTLHFGNGGTQGWMLVYRTLRTVNLANFARWDAKTRVFSETGLTTHPRPLFKGAVDRNSNWTLLLCIVTITSPIPWMVMIYSYWFLFALGKEWKIENEAGCEYKDHFSS
jgi:hypothetical protein